MSHPPRWYCRGCGRVLLAIVRGVLELEPGVTVVRDGVLLCPQCGAERVLLRISAASRAAKVAV